MSRDQTSAESESTLGAEPVVVPTVIDPGTYLLVFEDTTTRMVPLPPEGDCVIGRGETCDVRIEDQRVSRTHARLTVKGGQVRVQDLGSQNGTRVNEETIRASHLLASGDVVGIGSAVLVFHAASRVTSVSGVLDAASFRARTESELERARQFSRPLTAVQIAFDRVPDLSKVQSILTTILRRADIASWSTAQVLAIVMPETEADEGTSLAQALLEALNEAHLSARAGIASCPDDALDAETLLAAARTSAMSASAQATALASSTCRVISLGSSSVLVADPIMIRLYELIERLAPSPLTVLIAGETGCGKELVAHALHQFSPRASRRLVAVNCASFNESLLESELFGHEKGAFTGAAATKEGVFEASDGGTIFLDEVGEMPASLQAKLLRVLETRHITRVGDTKERAVDLRVVAASHRDLLKDVSAGRFREDLFFRLSGATVWLPPLRDRPRELPLLARRFLTEACQRAGRPELVLTAGALARLGAHRWPGNVRELRNVMEYMAATIPEGVVEAWHISARLTGASAVVLAKGESAEPEPAVQGFRPLAEEIRDLEKRRMLEALESSGWNQTRAAGILQMPLRTFVTRFKQLDLGRQKS
jgi:two-component system, NtrC family, response regulator AtoC